MAIIIGFLVILAMALVAIKVAVGVLAVVAKIAVVTIVVLGIFSAAKLMLSRNR